MNWLFKFLVGSALALAALPGWPQSGPDVIAFDATTWPQLLAHGPRPAAYLFTTSYCSTCPDAFETLYKAARQSGQKVELAAVMMDVDGDQAIKHAHYFTGLTRLYAFDGFEPSIRQAVDPQWQNITPYVVLIDQQGRVQKTLGAPSAALLKKWLPG